jgi:hypothetical protein
MLSEWASLDTEFPPFWKFLLRHTSKFHRLDIFEIWELVTISNSPIKILEQANLVSKDLTSFLTSRWWILPLKRAPGPPVDGLWAAQVVKYRILKEVRSDFLDSNSKEKLNGVSSGITARLGISRSCEQKCGYVPPPLSTSMSLLISFWIS